MTFSVSGPSEVHLCGYWEPTEDLLDDADGFAGYGEDIDEDDDEDDLDEE